MSDERVRYAGPNHGDVQRARWTPSGLFERLHYVVGVGAAWDGVGEQPQRGGRGRGEVG
ncbi:hypothetical protein P6B95_41095 [Streptomyces atratus]|uniref:hypothetical protein n=1 Tax=Streptomyces atratus TaxID=1893 RepID=UPI002AC36DD9|nr:hypothetical protein [Streptomyces atratus]WPW33792.1 hypothetical protein P6B95_41095 [Streptomyces atratus]